MPDDQKLAKLAVDHRGQVVAGLEPVCVGKRLVDQHFVVAPGLEVAAGAKDQPIEGSLAAGRD